MLGLLCIGYQLLSLSCIRYCVPYIGLFSLLKYFRECLQSRKFISRIPCEFFLVMCPIPAYDDAVLQHCHAMPWRVNQYGFLVLGHKQLPPRSPDTHGSLKRSILVRTPHRYGLTRIREFTLLEFAKIFQHE